MWDIFIESVLIFRKKSFFGSFFLFLNFVEKLILKHMFTYRMIHMILRYDRIYTICTFYRTNHKYFKYKTFYIQYNTYCISYNIDNYDCTFNYHLDVLSKKKNHLEDVKKWKRLKVKKLRQNYNINSWSLPYEHNWSLKFKKWAMLVFLLTTISVNAYVANSTLMWHFFFLILVFLFSVSVNSFFFSPILLQALIFGHLHLD